MINYGRVKSTQIPPSVEITPNYVYVASNLETLVDLTDELEETIYVYDYVGYTKDEYINVISAENAQTISELSDELAATKILLGVD